MLPKVTLLLLISLVLGHAAPSSSAVNSKLMPTCSKKGEADDYASIFFEQDLKASQCPDTPWMKLMRDADLISGKNDDIFINIGFNKGYNFATWGELFMPWSSLDAGVWYNTMLENNLTSVWLGSIFRWE